jgi:hypothetical protein
MPHATTEQITWLKTVFGLDLATTGEPHEDEDEAKGPETPDEDQVKGGLFEFFKQKVGETVGTRPPLPKDTDLAPPGYQAAGGRPMGQRLGRRQGGEAD